MHIIFYKYYFCISPFPSHTCHHIWVVLKYKDRPSRVNPRSFPYMSPHMSCTRYRTDSNESVPRSLYLHIEIRRTRSKTDPHESIPVPSHICRHICVVLGIELVLMNKFPVPYIYIKYRYAVLGLN